jgi:hypothetical protein
VILPDGAAQDRATDVLLARRRCGVLGTHETGAIALSIRPSQPLPQPNSRHYPDALACLPQSCFASEYQSSFQTP